MRLHLLFLIVLTLILQPIADAQKSLPVRKRDFRTAAPGLKEAWAHLRQGDQYFIAGGVYYGKAYDEYLKASLYNPSNARLNYNLGLSSLYSDDKADAAAYLKKAYELDNKIHKDYHLHIGQALHYYASYKEAIDVLNTYLMSDEKKKNASAQLARKHIEECRSALELTKDTLKIGISNMGPAINTFADEYSQVFSADESTMYFGTRQGLPRFSDYYKDSKFDENIFVTSKAQGIWKDAVSAGKELTTVYCESPLLLSMNGSVLYIYVGYENGGDILKSEKKKGEWGPPKKIEYKINSTKKESTLAISPSGKEVIFVSEAGKPNLGGKDIFLIRELAGGKWSDPENLGVGVNTEWDEESVAFSRTGDTLWFSSKGHNTMGGFDIFFSARNNTGGWSGAVNAGYPLNTQFDDLFFQPSVSDDSLFYFVSNRIDGFGGLDIYEGRITPAPKPEPVAEEPVVKEPEPPVVVPVVKELVFFLKGKVTDSESGNPMASRLDVIEIATNLVVGSATSSAIDGSYSVRLPEKKSYLLEIRSQGYLSDLRHVSVPAGYEDETITFNVNLAKVKVGKKVVLNNILFETGKAILAQSSYPELNRLLAFMLENPGVKVEISGHTDSTGSATLNNNLSNNRAKAVVAYLVQKGIPASRITSRGFGSTQPAATNSTAEGRAKNRRVEMKILEI